MRIRVRKTAVLAALIYVLLIGPIMLARYLLELSRPDALVGDQPNYLAHQYPPREKREMSPRLARLLQKEMHAVEAVPRIFLARLPGDLPALDNAREKKRLFTSAMLPIILRANELIVADRGVLLSLKKKILNGAPLRHSEKKWLQKKARQYRIRRHTNFTLADIDLLIFRCDVIPPSLAIAQAAMESGWGTSRFAQAGNALFGEWVWGDAEGLTPLEREEGKTHKVKSFEYLLDSVLSYMTNLNRHPSYRDLRLRRAELRQHNLSVTGAALAPALVSYSERGAEYVSDILSIINFNGLDGLDSAQLASHLEG
ncbi:glucosaminidase domain-containing protein [Kordiimonas sp.]|uniref:glucosaminidase domain-containing protein n=1 Tax=Kordiimonas sp. TaxID=1970157 RepID=UPI003A8D0C7B